MKTKILLGVIVGLMVISSGCKKDSTDEYPFAKETLEQGKQNLEEVGVELVNELRILRDSEAMEAMAVMFNYMGQGSLFGEESFESTPLAKPFIALAGIKQNSFKPDRLFKSTMYEGEEFASIQEIFNEYAGIYNWNSGIEDWDIVSATGKIEFNFPSTEDGTSNDAKLLFTYQGTNQYPILIPDYTGDLPVSFSASFSVGSVKHIEYTLNFAYNNDGVPTSITTELRVSTFVISFSWQYTPTKVTIKHSIKNGSKVLTNLEFNTKGVFSSQEIEDLMAEGDNVEDIFHTANLSYQVLGIKMIGDANIKALAEADESIYAGSWYDEDFDYVIADQQMAEVLNDEFKIIVVYASNNKKIAESEWYQYTITDSWSYNGINYDEVYSQLEMRFIFADESRIDIETYFGTGFGNLVAEMNQFIAELNAQYDLDFGDIDY